MSNAFRALMLGPPGAGKGTQGSRLADRYGVPHIASGDLLRQHVEQDTELGRAAAEAMSRGDLTDDLLVMQIVLDQVFSGGESNGFVLDGFPRNLDQAIEAYERASRLGIVLQVVILLEVADDELVRRLLGRAKTEERDDDTADTILHRIAVYRDQTLPLTDYYDGRDILLRVDGNGSIDDVTETMFRQLDDFLRRRPDGPRRRPATPGGA